MAWKISGGPYRYTVEFPGWKLIAALPIIIFVAFLVYSLWSASKAMSEEFKSETKGTIIQKKQLGRDHFSIIVRGTAGTEIKYSLVNSREHFQKIDLGDSVCKERNSWNIVVFHKHFDSVAQISVPLFHY